MIFDRVQPIAAGYYQWDLAIQRPSRDVSRQAALLYLASGRGTWTVGPWKFYGQRGDMLAVPPGQPASADPEPAEPLGYYYAYFEAVEGVSGKELDWPWDFGADGLPPGSPIPPPHATGAFQAEIPALYRQLQDELSRRRAAQQTAARARLALLGVAFARMLALNAQAAADKKAARAPRDSGRFRTAVPEPIRQTIDYVLGNLNRDISLEELARVARYSQRQFCEVFRRAVGMAPMAFVRTRRIREAQRLLAQGDLSVKEVSARLNFADPHHFSRVFREETGISPTEYSSGIPPVRGTPSGFHSVYRPKQVGGAQTPPKST